MKMLEKLPRILVIDACILFSFFNKDSDRRRIIEELSNIECRLISPKFVFEELVKKKERIKKFGKINELAFAFLLSLLDMKIESFPEDAYKEFLSEANKISPHGEQVTMDDPYFALALAFNTPIWSDEEAFKNQSSVKIFTTNQLDKLLRELDESQESPKQTLSELRKLFEKNRVSDEDSTELIRKMRDKKYDW